MRGSNTYMRIVSLSSLCLSLLVCFVDAERKFPKKTYDKYTINRLTPKTDKQLAALNEIISINEFPDVEFFRRAARVNDEADVLVPPTVGDKFEQKLKKLDINSTVLIGDVGKFIKKSKHDQDKLYSTSDNFYVAYHRYDKYMDRLDELASGPYKPYVKVLEIGQSVQRRPIKVLKLSTTNGPSPKGKPIVFLDCMHHAREWITIPICFYWIDYLLNNFHSSAMSGHLRQLSGNGKNASRYYYDQPGGGPGGDEPGRRQLHKILKSHDFYILPVVNPDGYEFSHTNDRMWRKNMARASSRRCFGTDLNRNYPYRWNQRVESDGSHFSQCAETYHGSSAGSEPEIKALERFLSRIKTQVKLYVSLHSFGEMILYPPGYDKSVTRFDMQLRRIASAGQQAATQSRYRAGPINRVLYQQVTGDAIDFFHYNTGIQNTFCIELPGKDSGFLLPPSNILPVGQETVQMLVAMVNAA